MPAGALANGSPAPYRIDEGTLSFTSMGEPADVNTRLRRLPKVDEVLRDEPALRLLERAPRWAVVDAIRVEIESLRAGLLAGREGEEAAPREGDGAEPAI